MRDAHPVQEASERREDGGRPSGRRRPSRMPHEVRSRRRRLITYGLLAASGILMVNALVGDKGYLARISARREQAALEAELARVTAENARLADEAWRLQHDPATIEDAARRDHNLIKPGEVLVIVHDSRPQTPRPASAR